jgi:type IV pilus assembly protein PilC
MIQGVVEAPNVEAVIEDLRNVRYTVTNVKEQVDPFAAMRAWRLRMSKVNLWSMVVFTRQFATIFNSGVPLIRGLEGLSKQTLNRRLSIALEQVYADVKNGMSMARALAKHPDVFSPVYIALVRAGEMAGALGEILDRTAGFLERDFQLRKRVQSATTYPILVFFITVIVTAILVLWVFPTFVGLLDGLNVALPWPTRLLMFITAVVYNWMFLIALPACLVLGFVSFKRWIKTRTGRRIVDHLVIEIPLVGPINKKVVISRFCRTLATLIQSGVPMMHALEIVSKVAGNEVVSEILDEVKRGVKAGMKLSQPLREYHLFPPIVPHMVSVGEETGNLPDVLQKLANFYDNEVEASLDAFSSLIEPIMIVFMGGVVGFVLLAVFLPVYQILQNFS